MQHSLGACQATNPEKANSIDWKERYLDYSVIILWVLDITELASIALIIKSVTIAGIGAGVVRVEFDSSCGFVMMWFTMGTLSLILYYSPLVYLD